jgi:phage shock protein A
MEDVQKQITQLGQEIGKRTARVSEIVGRLGISAPSRGRVKRKHITNDEDAELKRLRKEIAEFEKKYTELRAQLL